MTAPDTDPDRTPHVVFAEVDTVIRALGCEADTWTFTPAGPVPALTLSTRQALFPDAARIILEAIDATDIHTVTDHDCTYVVGCHPIGITVRILTTVRVILTPEGAQQMARAVGGRLGHLMKEMGISRSQAAQMFGVDGDPDDPVVPASVIGSYIRGGRIMPLWKLFYMCSVLDIPLADLLPDVR